MYFFRFEAESHRSVTHSGSLSSRRGTRSFDDPVSDVDEVNRRGASFARRRVQFPRRRRDRAPKVAPLFLRSSSLVRSHRAPPVPQSASARKRAGRVTCARSRTAARAKWTVCTEFFIKHLVLVSDGERWSVLPCWKGIS